MMTHPHVIMSDYCHITLIAFDCQPPRYHILSMPNPHNCLSAERLHLDQKLQAIRGENKNGDVSLRVHRLKEQPGKCLPILFLLCCFPSCDFIGLCGRRAYRSPWDGWVDGFGKE